MKISESKELAYWVGVAQSDGHLSTYGNNRRVMIGVREKSLPMLKKFQMLSGILLDKYAKIYKDKGGNYVFAIGVKKIMSSIRSLNITFGDPPKPPTWALTKNQYFGAYLAGLIDGDGDVRVKRKKYPQCVIRINSGKKQEKLKNCIEKIIKCSASTKQRYKEKILDGRKICGSFYELEFYVSSKNYKFVKNFITPNLQLIYKKEKIMNFILGRLS